MSLSLIDIFTFCKCTISSRNLIEGECVLNGKKVILCGKVENENSSTIATKSLVLRTSCLSSMPHEVNCSFKTKREHGTKKISIESTLCTYPAGASECCKHIVAVLLFLNK
ncbi:uncharacterized protein LOC126837810 [Adelges cooleyi]|uniref:uncharacterized protein LOC126837810 n=1 Tax=Adelges cooleyi TaxID=133065 RepID=UPI00217F6404|nr:uncharacterized protein LOC126837810 [Adelges cooleyi]